jgi:hypothetical protein
MEVNEPGKQVLGKLYSWLVVEVYRSFQQVEEEPVWAMTSSKFSAAATGSSEE